VSKTASKTTSETSCLYMRWMLLETNIRKLQVKRGRVSAKFIRSPA